MYVCMHIIIISHRIDCTAPRLDDAQDLVLIYSSSSSSSSSNRDSSGGVVVDTGAQDVGRVEVPEPQVSVTARA